VQRVLVVLVIAALVVWRFHLWPRHDATPPPSHHVTPIPPPEPSWPDAMVPTDAAPVVDAAPPGVTRLPIPAQKFNVPADIPLTDFVAGIVAVDGQLVWTDNFGSIWTMPATGGQARELANQHDGHDFPQYMALAVHRGTVYASRRGEIATVALPAGPVKKAWDDPEDDAYHLASDGTSLYGALFDGKVVVRFADDGAQTKLAAIHEAVLAEAGSAIYAADFGTGAVVELAPAHRTIARGIPHPTGLAVDDRAAYVWSQLDGTLRRIELATGKVTWRIALSEGDPIIADGDWIYGHSTDQGTLAVVRIAKDGSELDVLAPVDSAGRLAVDADAIYAGAMADAGILRIDKARVQPLRVVKPATVAP
jgi:outer membrane protein assembly factor BamB